MSKDPFFSIVMPSYGVELYISKAIQCILNQTFSDWELLVVDDKSTDSTGLIAEKYAQKDNRITVVHSKVNNGVAESRNCGLRMARGSYIWFPDPDDLYCEDLLQIVFDSITKHQDLDLVMFGHVEQWYRSNGTLSHKVTVTVPENMYLRSEDIKRYVIEFEESTQYGYPWNKVYSLSYLKKNNLFFRGVSYIEDIDFNIRVFQNISSALVLKNVLYAYSKRPSVSLTGKYDANFFSLHRERIQLLLEQQAEWGNGAISQSIYERLGILFCRYVIASLRMNCYLDANMKHADRKRWCLDLYKDSLNRKLISSSKYSNSFIVNICIKCIKTKKTCAMLAIGRLTYLTEKYFYPLISILKKNY